ncbi:hypothetical protein JD969_07985 [Planctomycetota bacterium]|nr:hypothetical protein JD969_07985 [Planctomycetota bacterium]
MRFKQFNVPGQFFLIVLMSLCVVLGGCAAGNVLTPTLFPETYSMDVKAKRSPEASGLKRYVLVDIKSLDSRDKRMQEPLFAPYIEKMLAVKGYERLPMEDVNDAEILIAVRWDMMLEICAVECEPFLDRGQLGYMWNTSVMVKNGEISKLSDRFSVMLAAVESYVAEDTNGETIEVVVNENHRAVRAIACR